MSYQPPPKSPYGDTELTDDGWSRTSTSSQADYPTAGTTGAPPPPSMYGRPPQANFGPPGRRLVPEQPAPAQFASITNSMTQEDIIFMRKVRKDCFLYRILPISAVSCGGLYMYNKSKNLPHKFGRYLVLMTSSAFLGIATFRNHFINLISENRSNTLYMQTLRKSVNLPALSDDFAGDYGMEYGSKMASDGSTNWDATDLSTDPRFSGRQNRSPTQTEFEPTYQPLEPLQGTPQQGNSYEEMRARNRGYIK